MNFNINKGATLPILKMELIKDGRYTYHEFNNMLQNSKVYFSMSNITTGVKKIGKKSAICILKSEYDKFRDAMFDTDMIKGDPAAVAKWKKATQASSEYKKTFNDEKVIKDFINKEATPEEMRKWLFNTSSVGLKPEAGTILANLKKIIGEDSPQMTALRQDAMLDIMEPLLREKPNFSVFVKNYETLVFKNKTLIDELLPDSKTNLHDLYKFAKANDKAFVPPSDALDWRKLGAVALVGHGIAVAGRKVAILTQAFDLVATGHTHSARRQILGEIMGYDPYAPILPRVPAIIGGGIQAVDEANEQ